MPSAIRWLDNAPSRPLEFAQRFEKQIATTQRTSAKTVVDFGKEAYLTAMAGQMPGKSLSVLGYSHHKERYGKFFLVRTRVAPDARSSVGTHAVVWAVPPGPNLLQVGAQAHNERERLTGRSRRVTWRKAGPANPVGIHPGTQPRPWLGPANETVARYARVVFPRSLPTAIERSQRAL